MDAEKKKHIEQLLKYSTEIKLTYPIEFFDEEPFEDISKRLKESFNHFAYHEFDLEAYRVNRVEDEEVDIIIKVIQ